MFKIKITHKPARFLNTKVLHAITGKIYEFYKLNVNDSAYSIRSVSNPVINSINAWTEVDIQKALKSGVFKLIN